MTRKPRSHLQYAVTDYVRTFSHGGGVPGIFFKYELEPMSITIRERTTTLYQFLIRLVGVVGKCNRSQSTTAYHVQAECGRWPHSRCASRIVLSVKLSRLLASRRT